MHDEIIIGMDGSIDSDARILFVPLEEVTKSGGDFEEYVISDDFLSDKLTSLAVGDVNNDGDEDFVAGFYSKKIHCFEQTSTAWTAEWNYLAVTPTAVDVASIELCDLDLDGYLDIIAGLQDGQVIIQKNTGDPHSSGFNSPVYKSSFGFSTQILDMETGDLDLDGDLDIICALSNGSVIAMENPLHMPLGYEEKSPFAAGFFNTKNLVDYSGTSANVLVVTDFNSDSDLDLVVGLDDGNCRILNNIKDPVTKSRFQFGPKETILQNSITNNQFNRLSVGDIDNDGDPDLAVDSTTSASVRSNIYALGNPGYSIFKNLSESNDWTVHEAYYDTGDDYYDIELNDLDMDGNLDIAFIENRRYIRALQNDGTPMSGLWASAGSATTLVDTNSYSVCNSEDFLLGDFDKDYEKEFIWAGSEDLTNKGDITAFRQQAGSPWSSWNDKIDIISSPEGQVSTYVVAGYFDNDNFIDYAFFDDGQNVFLIKGSQFIDDIGASDYAKIWQDNSYDVSNIAPGEIGFDKRQDLYIVGAGDANDVNALSNSWVDILSSPSWPVKSRSLYGATIDGIKVDDFDNDGIDDAIFWNNGEIRIFGGNRDEDTEVPNYLVDNIGENIIDMACCDFDQDGDVDFVVTTANNIYLYFNRLGDDLNLPELTLTFDFEGYNVDINVTSNETLYFTPQIEILRDTEYEYGKMADTVDPLKWTYEYYIIKNGTYYVTVNATDMYGGFVETTDSFIGERLLAIMHFDVQGPWIKDYSNESVEITITNSSKPVFTDYNGGPEGNLIINITDPSLNTEWYIATWDGGSTWTLTYDEILETGTYTIGFNLTDHDYIVYSYLEYEFTGDIDAPYISTFNEPDPISGELYYTMDGMTLDFDFNEPIIEMKYWFTQWNPDTEEDVLISEIREPVLLPEGNTTIDLPYTIPEGKDGDMNITIQFVDKAGNYGNEVVNISIFIYYPVSYSFYFRDIETSKRYITETGATKVLIAWNAVNCTHIRYRVDFEDEEGTWSDEIPFNDIDRYNYQVPLGSEAGNYTVNVRFFNYHHFVDTSKNIEYTGPNVPPFPWWWFVIAASGGLIAYIIYKALTREKEKSWKSYLDKPL
ncbi:MAG: hypothetical protein GF364_08545 [Candidatus Lokiarchaeota archaeon]|nr:hypothetical protein [Candidatus Lokiarchaeota archaeon]